MREILLTFNTLKTSLHINLFTFSSEMSNANTRSSLTDLRLPYVKTEFAKSKISYSGASLFNSSPNDLKIIANHTIS